jgi:hypothetical protein
MAASNKRRRSEDDNVEESGNKRQRVDDYIKSSHVDGKTEKKDASRSSSSSSPFSSIIDTGRKKDDRVRSFIDDGHSNQETKEDSPPSSPPFLASTNAEREEASLSFDVLLSLSSSPTSSNGAKPADAINRTVPASCFQCTDTTINVLRFLPVDELIRFRRVSKRYQSRITKLFSISVLAFVIILLTTLTLSCRLLS